MIGSNVEYEYFSKFYKINSAANTCIDKINKSENLNLSFYSGKLAQIVSYIFKIKRDVTSNRLWENKENSPYKILLVSYFCPTRAHAGGLRILDIYKLIKSEFPYVHLTLFTFRRENIDWKYDDINGIFDEIYFSDEENLSYKNFLRISRKNGRYNVVDFQFHQAAQDMDSYKMISDIILFTPMELLTKSFFDEIKNKHQNDLKQWLSKLKLVIQEVTYVGKADSTICVSKSDAMFLKQLMSESDIKALETGLSELEFPVINNKTIKIKSSYNKNKILIYVAYFGSQTNVDALKWFLEKVHPIIKLKVPDYIFNVVGRGDLSSFESIEDKNINFVGEVDELGEYIESAKVGIAPALFGSGFRGKINQYAIYNVPSVVTSISAEGLSYVHGQDILIADKPDEFAKYCIRLLVDDEYNMEIGSKSRETCFEQYTWKSKQDLISEIYNVRC